MNCNAKKTIVVLMQRCANFRSKKANRYAKNDTFMPEYCFLIILFAFAGDFSRIYIYIDLTQKDHRFFSVIRRREVFVHFHTPQCAVVVVVEVFCRCGISPALAWYAAKNILGYLCRQLPHR